MPSSKPSPKLSPELKERLGKLSPEELDKVLSVTSKLLVRRAEREKTGQTDLTVPFDPKKKA